LLGRIGEGDWVRKILRRFEEPYFVELCRGALPDVAQRFQPAMSYREKVQLLVRTAEDGGFFPRIEAMISDPTVVKPKVLAESSKSTQTADVPRFVFRRIAPRAWHFAFSEEKPQSVHVHYEAFTYIAKLLEKPRTEIWDIDLRFWDEPILAVEAKRQVQDDAMTSDGRRKIEAEISRLEIQAEADDPAEAAEAREMLDLLREQLRQDSGFGKRRKAVRKTPAQAAQSLVDQNLEKAITALADVGMTDLAMHLKKYIRKTGNYGREYAPLDPTPAWEVGWIIPKDSQSSQ